MSRSLHALLAAVVQAGEDQRHPIPDSDLDDEQPISLDIRITLGELRAAGAACYALRRAMSVGYIKVLRDAEVADLKAASADCEVKEGERDA